MPSWLKTILLCTALTVFAAPLFSQPKVDFGNGPDGKPRAPEVDKVKAIDPTPEEAEQIASLIDELGAGRIAQRERAMVDLAAFEGRALGQIREAKNHDDDEVAMRAAQLETVIEENQGPLFLAARRLNLSIADLNARLTTTDLEPLLSMLNNKAEAGMVSLWALIFRRLSERTQLYTAATICRKVEGSRGYGEALVRAASDKKLANDPKALISLSFLMPAETAKGSVDLISALYMKIGQNGGADFALRNAGSLRSFFQTSDVVAALPIKRVPHKESSKVSESEYFDIRAAICFTMIDRISEAEVKDRRIPSVTKMSPFVLDAWLNMLARSELSREIENTLVQLVGTGADNARVKSAAGAWASIADQKQVIELFPSLPIASRMAIIDAWWAQPRDAKITQIFAIELAYSDQAWSREGGIRLLSQLQSSNTISALLKSSKDHPDTAHFAFSALTNMAEALNADQINKLIAMHPSADALARPSVVETLFYTGNSTAHEYLIFDWKKWLPRNELIFAVQVFAQETTTPIGAISAAFLPRNNFDESETYSSLMDSLDSHDLVLFRSILSMNNQDGFALLKTLASDDRETWRNIYALAIAIAGKDRDLISDWIKRLTGETPDPTPTDFGAAISASLTPEAEKFRVSIHEEGTASSHYSILFWSVMNGRCQAVSTDDVRKQIFLSNDAIGFFGRTFIRLTGEITKQEALKFASYELSSDGASSFLSSWYMHMVRQSGADALTAMFGSSDNPTPRDNIQILATAMLGEQTRAREILKNVEFDKTGNNFQSLLIARAWLNMLDAPRDNVRIRYVYGFSAAYTFGQIRRLSLTRDGDIFALRELLDSSHPVNKPFANLGVVASITFEAGRWGDVESKMSSTVRIAMGTRSAAEPISISMFARNLKGAPERNWQRWWQAHRARVIWNQTTKNFELAELQ